MRKKSPWIAAILNLLFLGAGYVYLKKRIVFGWILILAVVIMTIEYFIGGMDHFVYIAETHSISWTVVTIALAYDVFQLAKNKR